MKITIQLFGSEVRVKEEISLEPESPAWRDVLRMLKHQLADSLGRFVKDDLSPQKDCAILINGRNVLSLDANALQIKEGDEITFTVMVAGG